MREGEEAVLWQRQAETEKGMGERRHEREETAGAGSARGGCACHAWRRGPGPLGDVCHWSVVSRKIVLPDYLLF